MGRTGPKTGRAAEILGMLGFLVASIGLIIGPSMFAENMHVMANSVLGLFISATIYLVGIAVSKFDGITETANPFLIPTTFRNDGSILIH